MTRFPRTVRKDLRELNNVIHQANPMVAKKLKEFRDTFQRGRFTAALHLINEMGLFSTAVPNHLQLWLKEIVDRQKKERA